MRLEVAGVRSSGQDINFKDSLKLCIEYHGILMATATRQPIGPRWRQKLLAPGVTSFRESGEDVNFPGLRACTGSDSQ